MNTNNYNHKIYANLNFDYTQKDFQDMVDSMKRKNMTTLEKFLSKKNNLTWGVEQVYRSQKSQDTKTVITSEYWGFGKGNVVYNIEEVCYWNDVTGVGATEYFIHKIYHDEKGAEIYNSDIDGYHHTYGGPTIYTSLKSAKNRCNKDYQNMISKNKLSWNYKPLVADKGKTIASRDNIDKQLNINGKEVKLEQIALGKGCYYMLVKLDKSDDLVRDESDRYFIRRVSLKNGSSKTMNKHLVNYKTAIKTAELAYQKEKNNEKSL